MGQLVLHLQRSTKKGFLCFFFIISETQTILRSLGTQRELFVKLSVGCVIIHFNII